MAEVTVLVETPAFVAGYFRCPPADDRWREENWIGRRHVLAFPRRAVLITRSARRRVVANPNHVVLYNPGETYRRELLAPEGDESLFIEVRSDAAAALLTYAAGEPPIFRLIESAVPDRLALDLHALELGLRATPGRLDPIIIDEVLASIVAAVAARSDAPDAGASRSESRRRDSAAARRRLVDDTRALLSTAYTEPLTLADVGRCVGASPFHLARTFRALTGLSIHRYRERLRLREALRRIRDGDGDLARTAVDLGFASHSHLDDRFRRTFGMSPSAARRLGLGSRPAVPSGA